MLKIVLELMKKQYKIGKRIVDVFKTFGFCYLKNHGVDENLIEEYRRVSLGSFQQPRNFKAKYPMGTDYRYGWVEIEREKLNKKRSGAGDLHEAFNYSPKFDGAWPPIQKFEDLANQVFGKTAELAYRFCDVLSLGLNLPKDYTRNAHKLIGEKGNSSDVRTIYYPPTEPDKHIEPN